MVSRVCVKCNVCKVALSLRVSASGGRQNHQFNCLNCDSQLGYIYEVRDLLKRDILEEFQNCESTTEMSEENIINLSPDIPIPKKEINNKRYFPNIHLIDLAHKKYGDNIEGVADGQAIFDTWSEIKTNWDLLDNCKYQFLKERIPDYIKYGTIERAVLQQLFSFASFCHIGDMISPSDTKFVPLVDDLVRNNRAGLERFLDFHSKELFNKNIAFYKQAFNDLFANFHDIKQVRHLAKCGADPADYVISSVHFEESKKIYGNLFETLGKTFNTVPLLIRLKATGSYDSLTSISVESYLKTSIQSKLDTIPSTSILTLPNADITNNRIRNASHHNSISYDRKSQTVVCDDKGQIVKLNYLDYLFKCTHLLNYILGQAIIDFELYMLNQDSQPTRRKSPRNPQPEKPENQEPPTKENKIGRNDPCPCRSGKKFKMCHGR